MFSLYQERDFYIFVSSSQYMISFWLKSYDFLTIKGKLNSKPNQFVCTVSRNDSMVQFNNLFCNSKPKTSSASVTGTCSIQTIKLFKNPLQLFGWNGIAFILNANLNTSGKRDQCKLYGRIGKTVINGIANQVIYCSFQFISITYNFNIFRNLEIPLQVFLF